MTSSKANDEKPNTSLSFFAEPHQLHRFIPCLRQQQTTQEGKISTKPGSTNSLWTCYICNARAPTSSYAQSANRTTNWKRRKTISLTSIFFFFNRAFHKNAAILLLSATIKNQARETGSWNKLGTICFKLITEPSDFCITCKNNSKSHRFD